LIFAYGLVDPDPSRPDGDITYHDTRRGSRTIPLRSYNDPPSEDKFKGLDTFEWRSDNVSIFVRTIFDIGNSYLFLCSISFRRMTQPITVKYTKHQVVLQQNDML
jgi:hypothetical protein